MTVRADRPDQAAKWRAARRFGATALIACISFFVHSPAKAQIGALVSIYSDDRFRGISVSDGRPVTTLDVSYDAPNGLYAGLSASLVASRDEGLKPLSLVLNGGYAKRLSSGLAADVGIIHSRYSHYSGLSSGRDYSEIYAALTGKVIGARVSLSPNYLGRAGWTFHGEVTTHFDLTQQTVLEGSAGLLVPLRQSSYPGSYVSQLDARLGIVHRLGPIALHAALTTHSGSSAIYGGRGHGRTALVIGISSAF